MKKIIVVAFMLFAIQIFAQETYGQVQGRLYLLEDRAHSLREDIDNVSNYVKRNGEYAFIDSVAKLAAYYFFLSFGWDGIYKKFWDINTRERNQEILNKANNYNNLYKAWEKYAFENFKGRNYSVYCDLVERYQILLGNGASRL